MSEGTHDSYISRHKTEVTAVTIGAFATSLAAFGLYQHHHHEETVVVNGEEVQFQQQTRVLNESRLEEERLIHLNTLAALFVVRRHLVTQDMLSATGRPKHYNSKSLGYLRDYDLVFKVEARKKPIVVAGYFAVSPALDWAAQRPEEFPLLADQLMRQTQEAVEIVQRD
jgi:hypothetical protein